MDRPDARRTLGRWSVALCVALIVTVPCASPALGEDDNYEAMKNYLRAYTSVCKGFQGVDRAARLAHIKQKYDHLVYKMTAEGRDMLSRFGESAENCADGNARACSIADDLARTLLTLVDDMPDHRP
ncbi:MAG: hypothetical protein RDU20_12295 [Desulfomonilaceae bacterium]|nr:hypothetical protein [Desulfomonilaceae bacterium]